MTISSTPVSRFCRLATIFDSNEPSRSRGTSSSAVSHQLRLLRHLGLVTGTRAGRSVVYSLCDNHVTMLLDEAVYHIEHLRLGTPDQAATAG